MDIILIVLFILSAIFMFMSFEDSEDKFYKISHSTLTIVIVIALITYFTTPKPIDVYRGKTELEITYRDSIAIDSTVVFKNK